MFRQTVVRKIQQCVENESSFLWSDFECAPGVVQADEPGLVKMVRMLADPSVVGGRAAFTIKYRPLPDFHLTYFANPKDGSLEVQCSPSSRSALNADTFTVRWEEDSVVQAVYEWLKALMVEVGAHGLLRSEREALEELNREVEAKLTEIEEANGTRIADERIPHADLARVLERIADLERELQARIAQQGLDDSTRDKKLAELAAEVESLRFSVAVYTRRGVAWTFLRLILKFGGHAGDVTALASAAVKLLGQ